MIPRAFPTGSGFRSSFDLAATWTLSALWILLASSCTEEQAPDPAVTEGRTGSDTAEAGALPSLTGNVLLITIDTTRPDRLGCYGGDPAVCPTIDSLAAEGVVFERAYATVPHTFPSHSTLLTGEWPFVLGIRINDGGRVPQAARTLAEHLRDHGAATAAFPASTVLRRELGLDQGFDVYRDELVGAEDVRPPLRAAPNTVEFFREWFGEGQAPFFAWLHFFEPHKPYRAHAELAGRFASNYEGEIHLVDRALSSVFALLHERGVLEDTWVCITSDHGEGFGDHGEETHGNYVYDSTMRVPLIVWHPSLSPRRVESVVSLVDVAPTLLELVGAAPMPCSGQSFAGLLHAGDESFEERPVYLESYVTHLAFGWSPLEALVTREWKLIEAPRPELFRMTTDPGETRDVSDQAEVAARMRATLQRFRDERPALEPEELELDDEARRRLIELGYVAGGTTGAVELPPPGPDAGADPKDHVETVLLIQTLTRAQLAGDRSAMLAAGLEVLERDPDNTLALRTVGVELCGQGRYEQALESLDRLHELDRLDHQARVAHGVALLQRDRLDEAAAVLGRSLQESPADARALRWMAEVEERRGNQAQALKCYRLLLEDFEGPMEARAFIEGKVRALSDG